MAQGDSTPDYAAMLTRASGRIDWTKSAVSIERMIRGLNPWPCAYTALGGKTLKLWRGEVVHGDASKGAFGEKLEVTKDSLLIQTGDGLLAIRELQLEGRKRMETEAFLRGFAVVPGTVLGQED